MINVVELIQNYQDDGFSKEDAIILAKKELTKRRASLSKANKKAELDRVKEHTPKNKKYSVVYGARKGVM